MARFTLTSNPLADYLRNSREELQKVTWPTRKDVVRDTLVVVAISVALGLFFAGADYVLQIGFERLLEV